MAKTKGPTPAELYAARKQREEEEKKALMPPGLVNAGNTCFMNSVLQGVRRWPLVHALAHTYASSLLRHCWLTSSTSTRSLRMSRLTLRTFCRRNGRRC